MGGRARIVGAGRAGTSFERALRDAGWDVEPIVRRGESVAGAARGVDVVIVATGDGEIAPVAAAIEPVAGTVVLHLSGALGPEPVAMHPRHGVLHPLVALPDGERGARRLVGAWFGLARDGDQVAADIVADLRGHPVRIADGDWARYHAAAAIAANHLVALLGHADRVGAGVGLPLAALVELATGSLDDVAELGPAAALTGPVRRGDRATVQRHIDSLPPDEREAYRVMAEQAARLLPAPTATATSTSTSTDDIQNQEQP